MKKKPMRRTRRTHTPAFKAQVALAALRENKTLAELAKQFDANNRLIHRPSVAGAVSYDYDAAGNQSRKTEGAKVTHWVYDGQNRLIEIQDGQGGVIARYGYDPLDRRIWKEQLRDQGGNALAQARRTHFLYSDEGLIAEATQAITVKFPARCRP